jgi:hypothetical protein
MFRSSQRVDLVTRRIFCRVALYWDLSVTFLMIILWSWVMWRKTMEINYFIRGIISHIYAFSSYYYWLCSPGCVVFAVSPLCSYSFPLHGQFGLKLLPQLNAEEVEKYSPLLESRIIWNSSITGIYLFLTTCLSNHCS